MIFKGKRKDLSKKMHKW